MYWIIALGVLSGSPTLEDLADRVGATKAEVCAAYKKIRLIDGTVPDEAACRRMKKQLGNKCHVHYSIVGKVCQCNEGSKHSEQILIKAGKRTFMNEHNPCWDQCYPFMIRDILKNKKAIRITYGSVKDPDGYNIHKNLARECAELAASAR